MSASDLPMGLWILLIIILTLQVLLWMGQFGLSLRLRRIEKHLISVSEEPAQEDGKKPRAYEEPASANQKRLFHEFLDEQPERRQLSKKEQSTAFRKWRNERGLNWGK